MTTYRRHPNRGRRPHHSRHRTSRRRGRPPVAAGRRVRVGGELNALDVLGDAFDVLTQDPGALALPGRLIPGLPARRMLLDEIGDRLRHHATSTATRDAIWAQVILRARHNDDPCWRVGAAGLALPDLVDLTREVATRYRVGRAEVAGDVLAGFLAALDRVDPNRQRITTWLQDTAHRAAIAALPSLVAPAAVGGDALGSVREDRSRASQPPPVPYQHRDLVLIRAVADDVLSPTDADLIGATRIDGVSVQAWAEDNGLNPWTARQRRRRAELKVIGYLCDPTYESCLVDNELLARLARTRHEAAGIRGVARGGWCVCAAAARHADPETPSDRVEGSQCA